ncbi:MAG TPA: non-homologous end-joining DNA ligase [Planctomycetota bacterium]|nr:non-homologous end-joining DNA ligase [Planctomycetota bacterium]
MRRAVEIDVDGHKVKLSSLEKVLYPEAGFTKGHVFDYYTNIAPLILPHLKDRPLTLKRYPYGVNGPHFYEKQCPPHRPDWIKLGPMWSENKGRNIDFCIVDDLASLLWAVNLGVLEMHPTLAVRQDVHRPTTLAFDLDPGEPAGLIQCCCVALWIRDLFEELGLKTFPKTSGSRGMQIYAPLNVPNVTFEQTKPFAHAIAQLIEKQHPELVVSKMRKDLRRGKVFIDWSQNDYFKSTVCAYSLRAKTQRPTVSTPLTWEEVERAYKHGEPKAFYFEHDDVLKRVEKLGDLFRPVLKLKQRLPTL